MRLRINPFLVTASAVVVAGYGYVGMQLIGPVGASLSVGLALWLLLATPFALLLWLPLVYWRQEDDRPVTRGEEALLWGSYLSMGWLSLLLVWVALRDLVLLGFRIAERIAGAAGFTPPLALVDARSSGAILLLAGIAVCLGVLQARRHPRVSRVDVPIPGLAPELDGFVFAQVSDLHAGSTIGREYVKTVVRKVNALGADVVALTGDLVDGTPEQLRESVAPLAELKAREGCFYVTGNHEYYWGAQAWVSELRRLGAEPLLNEGRAIRRGGATLYLAGVTDYWAGRYDPSGASDPGRAIRGGEGADLRVLLAHQPKSAPEAARAGFDLQLSGHTHGGQFIPWTWVVGYVQPFARGLHRLGRMWVYVCCGTGYWGPPLRLGSRSEIACLTLRSAPGPAPKG